MHKLEHDKYEQINNILITVKLATLLFCGIISFKYLSNTILKFVAETSSIAILLIIICLLGIYIVWGGIAIKKFGMSSKTYTDIRKYSFNDYFFDYDFNIWSV